MSEVQVSPKSTKKEEVSRVILIAIIIVLILILNQGITIWFGAAGQPDTSQHYTARDSYPHQPSHEMPYLPPPRTRHTEHTPNNLGWYRFGARQVPDAPVVLLPQIMPADSINNARYITLHYTNWCGACKRMKPVWEKVKIATINSGIIFNEVDEDIAKTPYVKSYPTIIMLDERGERVEYKGSADFGELRDWCVSPITKN